jgi:hypothetical protein
LVVDDLLAYLRDYQTRAFVPDALLRKDQALQGLGQAGAADIRRQASEIVTAIANGIGDPALRASFLGQPAVQEASPPALSIA